MKPKKILLIGLLFFTFTSCNMPVKPMQAQLEPTKEVIQTNIPTPTQRVGMFSKGDMITYYAQSGDTLSALGARFRSDKNSIINENPMLSDENLTTLPPGLPLNIKLNFDPDWGSPAQIIPDYLFVNGPDQSEFDTIGYVNQTRGWLKNHSDIVEGYSKKGGEIVDAVAANYSVSPRLLLAILEYQLHALSDPVTPSGFFLGGPDTLYDTLYKQLYWAANTLNNGYYGWREGKLTGFKRYDGVSENSDPWQNAASVAIQYYYSRFLDNDRYQAAISQAGLILTYTKLFGEPDWSTDKSDIGIPGDLHQPELILPFKYGLKWAYTGGPHTGWGTGEPWAAIDFAPPADTPGCEASQEWAIAMADGVVARSSSGVVIVDLDGDGKYQTGWTLFYLHVAPSTAARVGSWVKTGDKIGHPSCDGGRSTGRHIHIARRYNGEWIPASGVIAFDLSGWVPQDGERAYRGTLVRGDHVIIASETGISKSQIMADPK